MDGGLTLLWLYTLAARQMRTSLKKRLYSRGKEGKHREEVDDEVEVE